MPSTGLSKPFILTSNKIDEIIKKISPGVYVLGHVNNKGVFIVEYVGRSDDDLNDRLHDWVGEYKQFKAIYYNSVKATFEKECSIYHDFGENEKLDNEIHPDCPDGIMLKCPICGFN